MALEVRTGRLSAPQRVDAPSGVRGKSGCVDPGLQTALVAPIELFWSSYPTRGCLLRALRCPDRPGMARPVKITSGISGEPQGLYERVSGRL